MSQDDSSDRAQSDAAFQLWLDGVDPARVDLDRSAGMVGEERRLFEAARNRALARERRREAFQREYQKRLESDHPFPNL